MLLLTLLATACKVEIAPVTDREFVDEELTARTSLGERTVLDGPAVSDTTGFGTATAAGNGRLYVAEDGDLCGSRLRVFPIPGPGAAAPPSEVLRCVREDATFGIRLRAAGALLVSGDHLYFEGQLDGFVSDALGVDPDSVLDTVPIDEDTLAVLHEGGLTVLTHERTWTPGWSQALTDVDTLWASDRLLVTRGAHATHVFEADADGWTVRTAPAGTVLAVDGDALLIDPGSGDDLAIVSLRAGDWQGAGHLWNARGGYETWTFDEAAAFGLEPTIGTHRGAIDRYTRSTGTLDASLRLQASSDGPRADLHRSLLLVTEPHVDGSPDGRVSVFDWSDVRSELLDDAGIPAELGICSQNAIDLTLDVVTTEVRLSPGFPCGSSGSSSTLQARDPLDGHLVDRSEDRYGTDFRLKLPPGTYDLRYEGCRTGAQQGGVWTFEDVVLDGTPQDLRLDGAWRDLTVLRGGEPYDGTLWILPDGDSDVDATVTTTVDEGFTDLYLPDGTYWMGSGRTLHEVVVDGPDIHLELTPLLTEVTFDLNGEDTDATFLVRPVGAPDSVFLRLDVRTWDDERWLLAPGDYDVWIEEAEGYGVLAMPYLPGALTVDGTGFANVAAQLDTYTVALSCNGVPVTRSVRWRPEPYADIAGHKRHSVLHWPDEPVLWAEERGTLQLPHGTCGYTALETSIQPVDGTWALDLQVHDVDFEVTVDGEPALHSADIWAYSVGSSTLEGLPTGTHTVYFHQPYAYGSSMVLAFREVHVTESGTMPIHFDTREIDVSGFAVDGGELRIRPIAPNSPFPEGLWGPVNARDSIRLEPGAYEVQVGPGVNLDDHVEDYEGAWESSCLEVVD